jgi:hypothetical protein
MMWHFSTVGSGTQAFSPIISQLAHSMQTRTGFWKSQRSTTKTRLFRSCIHLIGGKLLMPYV